MVEEVPECWNYGIFGRNGNVVNFKNNTVILHFIRQITSPNPSFQHSITPLFQPLPFFQYSKYSILPMVSEADHFVSFVNFHKLILFDSEQIEFFISFSVDFERCQSGHSVVVADI